jgi:hypothetical protein
MHYASPTHPTLIQKLREAASQGLDRSPGDPLAQEALTEILRLNQELQKAQQVLNNWNYTPPQQRGFIYNELFKSWCDYDGNVRISEDGTEFDAEGNKVS